jgi:hypothetical protein
LLIHNIVGAKDRVTENCGPDQAECSLSKGVNKLKSGIERIKEIINMKGDSKAIIDLQPAIAEGFSEHLEMSRLRYDGYCDDPRNTDDAWVHTFVHHVHIPDCISRFLNVSQNTRLWTPSGALTMEFRWMEVDSGLPEYRTLYASHFDFVELCVPFCKCGRRIYDRDEGSHARDLGSHAGPTEWSTKDMVGEERGADFGQMQFVGKSSPARYIRAYVGVESDDDVLRVRAMLDAFGLRAPDATIAVTGGAQDFAMDQQLTRAVFQGIVRAAETSKACIVDGGTDTGLMKLLGKAVDKSGYSVELIGVTGWGVVIGRDCMHRGPSRMNSRAYYSKTKPTSATGAGLEQNHKYFLLVDDGTVGKFGTEIAARSKLEEILREPKRFKEFRIFLELILSDNEQIGVVEKSTVMNKHALPDILKWTSETLIFFHKFLLASHDTLKGSEAGNFLARLDKCTEAMLGRYNDDATAMYEKFEIAQYLKGQPTGATLELLVNDNSIDISKVDGKVDRCRACEGADRDHVTKSRMTNSIEGKSVDCWYEIKLMLNRNPGHASKFVDCTNCFARIPVEDVRGESFVPCCSGQCKHYFFRRSLTDARRKGRESVICDGCLERVSLDSLLGRFVPGVLVVVQGGFGTIKTVAVTNSTAASDSMEQSRETCTPIVVVEGPGKASKFIAFTWRHLHQGDQRCHGHARTRCVAHTRRYQEPDRRLGLLPATCPVIEQEYCRLFGPALKDTDRQHISWIIETCRRQESVTLYSPSDSSNGLDFAILRAMCKGTLRDGRPLSTVEQLRLAIGWEHAEEGGSASTAVVREILAEDATAPSEAASVQKRRALIYALQRNSWRSAKLLVHAGVSLPREDAVFRALYRRERWDEVSAEAAVPNSLRDFLLSKEVWKWTIRAVFDDFRRGFLADEGEILLQPQPGSAAEKSNEARPWEASHAWKRVLRILSQAGQGKVTDLFDWGDGSEPPRLRGDVTHKFFSGLISTDAGAIQRELFGTRAHVTGAMRALGWARPPPDQEASRAVDEDASGELFVWAILMGRAELAKFFWRRSPYADHVHCISRALFASAVARRLAAHVDDQAAEQLVGAADSDEAGDAAPLSQRVGRDGGAAVPLAAEFGELAKRLVRRCFDRDQRAAVAAIQLPWTGRDSWLDCLGPYPQHVSPLQLAGMARAEDFVEDQAFQSCVDDVWYGHIALSYAAAAAAAAAESAADDGALVLPFARRGLALKLFLGLSAGAGAIPAIVLTAFYADFLTCIATVAGSYLVPVVCMAVLAGTTPSRAPRAAVVPGWWLMSALYTAPVVKFLGRSVHLLMLVLLVTYVGVMMNPAEYTPAEAAMHAWLGLLLLSEFRQRLEAGARWWESGWNKLDALFFCVLAASLAMRGVELTDIRMQGYGGYAGGELRFRDLGGYDPATNRLGPLGHAVAASYKFQFQDLLQARGLHGLAALVLWVRLLETLRVSPRLGPLVLILQSMVRKDLGRFALLLLVVTLGFGAAFVCAARPYPDLRYRCNGGDLLGETFDDLGNCTLLCTGQCHKQLWRYLSQSVSHAYFELYGEHFLGAEPLRREREECERRCRMLSSSGLQDDKVLFPRRKRRGFWVLGLKVRVLRSAHRHSSAPAASGGESGPDCWRDPSEQGGSQKWKWT